MIEHMMQSIRDVRTDITEIIITAETNLNSESFRKSVTGLPIVILRKFLDHPDCSEIRIDSSTSLSNANDKRDVGHAAKDFSMESLGRIHGSQKIVVLSQDVDVSGFKLDDKNLWEKTTLRSYLHYVNGLRQLLDITGGICVKKRESCLDSAIKCMEEELEIKKSVRVCCEHKKLKGNKISIRSDGMRNSDSFESSKVGSFGDCLMLTKSIATSDNYRSDKISEVLQSPSSHLHNPSALVENIPPTNLKFISDNCSKSGRMDPRLAHRKIRSTARVLANGVSENSAEECLRTTSGMYDSFGKPFIFNSSIRRVKRSRFEKIDDGTKRINVADNRSGDTVLATDNNGIRSTDSSTCSCLDEDLESARCQLLTLITLVSDSDAFQNQADIAEKGKSVKMSKTHPSKLCHGAAETAMNSKDGDILHSVNGNSIMRGALTSWAGIGALDFKRVNQDVITAMVGRTNRKPKRSSRTTADSQTEVAPVCAVKNEIDVRVSQFSENAPDIHSQQMSPLASPTGRPVLLNFLLANLCNSKTESGMDCDESCSTSSLDPVLLNFDRDLSYWHENLPRKVEMYPKGGSGDLWHLAEKSDQRAHDVISSRPHPVVTRGCSNKPGSVDTHSAFVKCTSPSPESKGRVPATPTSAREERNILYAMLCNRQRIAKLDAGFTPPPYSIPRGFRKRHKRKKPYVYGIMTPGSVRKRNSIIRNIRPETSTGEVRGSTVILRDQLRSHKQILSSLMPLPFPPHSLCSSSSSPPSVCSLSSESSSSCIVQYGKSFVCVRLSVTEEVWTLDLTFPPLSTASKRSQRNTTSSIFRPLEKERENEKEKEKEKEIMEVVDGELEAEYVGGGDRCIIYSPLCRKALENFAQSSDNWPAVSCDDSNLDYWLHLIVNTWPPLCSGRVTNGTARDSDVTNGITSNGIGGHIESVCSIDDVSTNMKDSTTRDVFVCDGLAMQTELLRMLKLCPHSLTALLASGPKTSPMTATNDTTVSVANMECQEVNHDDKMESDADAGEGTDIDENQDWSSPTYLTEFDTEESSSEIPFNPLESSIAEKASDTAKKKSKFTALTDENNEVAASHVEGLQAAKLVIKGRIKFCTNLDMSTWAEEMQILRRCMPAWMMCQSPKDLLRLLRQPIEGMSTPQVYIKVPGVWTGGHEENLRFRSVNCTVGPGSSEWFAVDKKHSDRVRQLVLDREGVDILGKEGSWFISPQFLAKHNIPFMHGIQGPNDVIITGGDTLHWVRALGFSTHYSWNFGVFECEQVEVAMARYRENERITKTRNAVAAMETAIRPKKDRTAKEKSIMQYGRECPLPLPTDAVVKRTYTPSTAIAFQSLVPMKTLILDVVRELIAMAATSSQVSVQSTIPRAINRRKMMSNNSGKDVTSVTGSLGHIRLVRDHCFEVMNDSSLLLLFLKELNQSIEELQEDLRTATLSTGLKLGTEDAGARILHCERTSCKMELFEAFVDCSKCGYICLQCAGGGGDATKGGCLGETYKRPSMHRTVHNTRRVHLPRTTESFTSTCDDVTVTDAHRQRETQMRPSIIQTEGGEKCRTNGAVASCPQSHSSIAPIKDLGHVTPQCNAEQCIVASHEHFKGARLLLKTPLTSLSKVILDFAHLIMQVHPNEKESVRALLGIAIG